jgi:glycosyltransferase involved in cell wall biosynthesis
VSAKRVDRFLANSKTVAARINKFYRCPAEVVYPPVKTDYFKPTHEAPGDYFLSVSRLISYKRIDLVIKACIATKSKLKVVGTGPEEASLKELAVNAPWIEFLGRVSDEELPGLYTKAKAFLFAAEEDFGIVPVEAMSAGRPVIAYGKGGATESVAEGLSGVFFKEQTSESLAEVLVSFDPAAWNSHAIHDHATTFDKRVFSERIKKIIEG